MFNENFNLRKKSDEELRQQVQKANSTLGSESLHSLTPPSIAENEILTLPLAEIKRVFARRYSIYVKLISKENLTNEELTKMRKWLMGLNSLDKYIARHEAGDEKTLRERQVPIFSDLRKFIEGGGHTGYVKLPTGVGKTVLFTELIEALDFKTLIVVPTIPLVDQTEEKLAEFAPDLEVGKIYKGAKQYNRQVTIITYDSLVSQLQTGSIKAEEFECLILDEAHLSLSDKRKAAVDQFKDTLVLGFTATPNYSEDKKLNDLLPTEIHQMEIQEAVQENLLCSFSTFVVRTEADLSKVAITDRGEWNVSELEKVVNIASRNQGAVDLYKQSFSGESAVTYCVNIKHADAVTELFNQQGVRAAVVNGQTPSSELKRIKQEFKEGKIKILCNADILIPGFDEPRASVCLNLRPTRSRVIAEQRGGRVLRINKNNRNKYAYVVDFLDKGVTEKNLPVLFAQIAKGAQFLNKKKGEIQENEGTGIAKIIPIANIPGLEVISEIEGVMHIVGKFNELEEEFRRKFLTYVELQTAVQVAEIKKKDDYDLVYRNHRGWPSNPSDMYSEWTNWANLLGKRQEFFIPFADCKRQVREAGVRTSKEYPKVRKNHPDWPSNPDTFPAYSNEWISWPDFLGTEVLNYPNLKEEVKIAGIKTKEEYLKAQPLHPTWPARPYLLYGKEWKSWLTFLSGENERVLTLDELKQEVQEAAIINYEEYIREHSKRGWPEKPKDVYGKKWSGWDDLLGIEKEEFIPLDKLKEEVRTKKIKSSSEYWSVYKRDKPKGWPSRPDNAYPGEWKSWDDFLDRKVFTYSELQVSVQLAGIKTSTQYFKVYKEKGWPSHPEDYPEWVSWYKFFGTE